MNKKIILASLLCLVLRTQGASEEEVATESIIFKFNKSGLFLPRDAFKAFKTIKAYLIFLKKLEVFNKSYAEKESHGNLNTNSEIFDFLKTCPNYEICEPIILKIFTDAKFDKSDLSTLSIANNQQRTTNITKNLDHYSRRSIDFLEIFFREEIFSPKKFENQGELNNHIKDLKQKYAFLQQHYAEELDSSDMLKKYRDSCEKRLAWLTALSHSFAIMSLENPTLKDKLYIHKVGNLLSQKEREFTKERSEHLEIFNYDTITAEQQNEHLHFIIHADELEAFKANFKRNKQTIKYDLLNGLAYQRSVINYANDQSTEHATALEELPVIGEDEKRSLPQELLTVNPHKTTIDTQNALVRARLRTSYYWMLGSGCVLPWIASTGIVRNGLSYLRQTALSSIAQSARSLTGSSLLQHIPTIAAGCGLIVASPHVYRSAKAGERTEWKAFGRLALLGASAGLSMALSGNLPSITGLKDALLATGCGAALGFGYCGLGKVVNTFSNGGCALPQQTSETIKDHLGLETDTPLLSNHNDVD